MQICMLKTNTSIFPPNGTILVAVRACFHSHATLSINLSPAQAYRVRFWMQLLGHGSPKPTVVYSNGSWVSWLDMGTLTKEYRLANTVLKTTRLIPRREFHLRLSNGCAWVFRYQCIMSIRSICQQGGEAEILWVSPIETISALALAIFLSLKPFSPLRTLPRCYPEGFARRLKEAFENRTGFPRHMRFKYKVDRKLTDRELFQQMPLGDVWVDAKMHLVWKYIYSSKYVTIPSSWENAMRQFDSELTAAVARLL